MKVLLTEEQISAGVRQLAKELNQLHGDKPLTIVGVMTGSIVLLADLIRLLEMPLRVGVIQTSSYRGTTERGALQINSDLMLDIKDRDVLLIDDIFDTGHTLQQVIRLMEEFNPASIRSAVLLRKAQRSEVKMEPDHVVFEIPDEFVIGYGLDYGDEYRNLPFIGVLEPSDLEDRESSDKE